MNKVLTLFLGFYLALAVAGPPANAAVCSSSDTEKVRALLVPVLRLAAYQGRNLEENHEVISKIRKITSSTKSPKLKTSLLSLEHVIQKGELNQGSTLYWGYKGGSAWKTYKTSLTLTQKDGCGAKDCSR
jgi:hypothetical protein